jgi:1L-myo-inositol 1-phosphate cytidylyltransferase
MSLAKRPVRRAVILAAGNGDRFHNPSHDSKLLHPLLGRPILLRTIEAAHEAGVEHVTIVLGYQAERVRALAEHASTPHLTLTFVVNPHWRLENGVSALAARDAVGGEPFALLMGDHVFDPDVLARMLRLPLKHDESVLAIDTRDVPPEVAEEATKVRLEGSRIVAIGKHLREYDALDTGVFVCAPSLFDALTAAQTAGDTTLSAGISRLAARGLMQSFDIGDADWCDIDTVSDLAAAESALAAGSPA